MTGSFGTCTIQFNLLFMLIFFWGQYLINEGFYLVFKRKVRLTVITFISIVVAWLIELPFHETALTLAFCVGLFGYYLGRGAQAFPRYIKRVPRFEEFLAIYDNIARKLSLDGRLLPYAIPTNLVATWLFVFGFSWLWERTFDTQAYVLLSGLSLLYGILIGQLLLLHEHYHRQPALHNRSIIKQFQYVFSEEIFGPEPAKPDNDSQSDTSGLNLAGGVIVFLGASAWLQILIAVILAVIASRLRSLGLFYTSFDDAISGMDLVSSSMTQYVDYLGPAIGEYAFNLLAGVAILRRQIWGKRAYLWFTPIILFISYLYSEDIGIIFWLNIMIYAGMLIYLNTKRIRTLFLSSTRNRQKGFGLMLYYLATLLFSWASVRLSSVLQLIQEEFHPAYILMAALSLVGIGMVLWSAKLFSWKHKKGIMGLFLFLVGFVFFINANYVAMFFCTYRKWSPDIHSEWLIVIGRFLFSSLFLLLGLYLLVLEKKAYGGEPPLLMEIPESPYHIGEPLQIAWENFLDFLRRGTAILLSIFLTLATLAFLFLIFNDFKLPPKRQIFQEWQEVSKAGDRLNAKKYSVDERMDALDTIANLALAAPAYHTLFFPLDQNAIKEIAQAFQDPDPNVRAKVIETMTVLIQERPEMYGVVKKFIVEGSMIETIYIQNYLKLAEDDSPRVRSALASSLADTDFLVQSGIRIELHSSRLTLIEMMKSEKDPAVLEVVRGALRLRIERDKQKGWIGEREAQKLIEKYGLSQ
jgi:hypothetical protein